MTFLEGILNAKQQSMIKVNRHKNQQLPGFSIYHDHAMRSTMYNVVKGMAGMYILYNATAEADYPIGN